MKWNHNSHVFLVEGRSFSFLYCLDLDISREDNNNKMNDFSFGTPIREDLQFGRVYHAQILSSLLL